MLLARLSYANLKVNQGWIKQNIDEVEHLYSSRFRNQAQERRLRRLNTVYDDAINPERAAKAFATSSPPLKEGDIQKAWIYSSGITHQGSHANVPLSRPFAEPNEDILATLKPPAPASQYLDYTPGVYAGYDPGISVYAPVDGYQPTSIRQGYLSSQSGSWQPQTTLSSNSPTLHQPSHSMYTYLASPVAGSTMQFAGPANANITQAQTSTGQSSVTVHSAKESDTWSHDALPLNSSVSTTASSRSNDQSDLDAAVVPTPQYGFTQTIQQQLPLAPAHVPAITPRPDLSAPTFTAVHGSETTYGAHQGHTGINAVRRHLRNPSLKGEYSVSSVTMDDLDSHFGQ